QELTSAQNRFRVGQITRTDVSQAQAGLAGAKAGRIGAEGTLKSSEATFMRVIGRAPQNLSPAPSFENRLPKTLAEAIDIAQRNSPDLLAAMSMEKSAQAGSSASKGALAPTVDLFATAGRQHNQPTDDYRVDSVAAGVRAEWALFDRGVTWSRVRQNKYTANQKRMELADARRVSRENTTKAWESLTAVNAQLTSIKAQIEANRLAAEGVKREARAGSRTVLDVLNAEQALLNSRVALAQTERDRMVAAMQLLAAIGRLNLKDMGI
ncbi:MAG: TolC family protein, partial [Alphaproteobacteria bacterium]|nr:TolC family protein [Alphaproteobacteria bacterium]